MSLWPGEFKSKPLAMGQRKSSEKIKTFEFILLRHGTPVWARCVSAHVGLRGVVLRIMNSDGSMHQFANSEM